jgi:hypothetical protein
MTDAPKKKKRPRDANQLAKSIVDLATCDTEDEQEESLKAVSGRKGGQKGGDARANKLTAAERTAIARKAAKARWEQSKQSQVDDPQNNRP